MKVYQASTTIAATPETIWVILTNAAGYSEWDPGVERIEGRIAPSQKITAYTKLSPGRAFPATVTEFEPGRKMTWASRMPLGLFKGERTFTLSPRANGATEFRLREEFSGLLLGLTGRSILNMTATFEQFAAGLKRRAERAG
jgi:hypothetical protein